MPTFLAILIAAALGWLVESPLRSVIGIGGSLVVSFVVTGLAFVLAKRFLIQLRDGG
jgi:hypothetical protein